jgi:hypothetical protein
VISRFTSGNLTLTKNGYALDGEATLHGNLGISASGELSVSARSELKDAIYLKGVTGHVGVNHFYENEAQITTSPQRESNNGIHISAGTSEWDDNTDRDSTAGSAEQAQAERPLTKQVCGESPQKSSNISPESTQDCNERERVERVM